MIQWYAVSMKPEMKRFNFSDISDYKLSVIFMWKDKRETSHGASGTRDHDTCHSVLSMTDYREFI